jgi:hypothetical protein
MKAIEIRDHCPNMFQRSYKFAFERHPVDKCLSHFAMQLNSPFHREKGNPATWKEYLERGQFPIDTDLYTDEVGKLIIDRIYKYEEIDEALGDIAVKTGLRRRALNVSEKSGFRYNVPPLSEIMKKPNDIEVIWKAFASTLNFVDYA